MLTQLFQLVLKKRHVFNQMNLVAFPVRVYVILL